MKIKDGNEVFEIKQRDASLIALAFATVSCFSCAWLLHCS